MELVPASEGEGLTCSGCGDPAVAGGGGGGRRWGCTTCPSEAICLVCRSAPPSEPCPCCGSPDGGACACGSVANARGRFRLDRAFFTVVAPPPPLVSLFFSCVVFFAVKSS